MPITITILNDNRTTGNNFCCEHGLSVHVSIDGYNILMDTGQTDKYVKNAETLGIRLNQLNAIVLSHGHYDHAGGLSYFPFTGKEIPLYLSPIATKMRYSLSTVMQKPNGFPKTEILGKFDVHPVDGIYKLNDKTTLFTLPSDAPKNEHLVVHGANGELVPDTFHDEVFTLIEYNGKNILFGGCTHHGLEQLLLFCRNNLQIKKVDLFVGGLHLSGKTTAEIEATATNIKSILPVEKWIVNHCTGEDAISYWNKAFGSTPKDGYAGSQITLN